MTSAKSAKNLSFSKNISRLKQCLTSILSKRQLMFNHCNFYFAIQNRILVYPPSPVVAVLGN